MLPYWIVRRRALQALIAPSRCLATGLNAPAQIIQKESHEIAPHDIMVADVISGAPGWNPDLYSKEMRLICCSGQRSFFTALCEFTSRLGTLCKVEAPRGNAGGLISTFCKEVDDGKTP
jgi:hypothetical protein